MTTPMRTVYAQSSDIRSRSWLQYRHDMKKKAIAELEFLPFLQQILADRHDAPTLRVRKHGGDALLWFNTRGQPVTQAPDYRASWGEDDSYLYEFQFAEESAGLPFFDFKEAKVGRKLPRQERRPHTDREFFYVVKDLERYAFIAPQWIADNGIISGVSAWGNRRAYRVPRDTFLPLFTNGGPDLANVLQMVDDKIYLLEFQAEFTEQETRRFARELQRVVDEEQLLSIVPRTLDGFYRVCYLLDKIGRQPDAPGVWLVYLLSFFDDAMPAIDFARYLYALDFLYFKCSYLQENEQSALEKAFVQATDYIGQRINADSGALATDPKVAPIEETRQVLFAVNLIEDLKQDAAVTWDANLPQASTIFEALPDATRTANYIRNAVGKP